MGIANCDSTAEECASAVLDVFHFPKLLEEIGPDEPLMPDVLFGKTEPLQVAEARRFGCGRGYAETSIGEVFAIEIHPASESPVQRRDAIRRQFDLLLLLDFLDGAWSKLPSQRALDSFTESSANQGGRKLERLAGWQPSAHKEMNVGMLCITMDYSRPLDRCSCVLLNAINHVPDGSVEISLAVFRRDDNLEDAFVSGALPVVCQRPKLMFTSQAKAVENTSPDVVFQSRLLVLLLTFTLRTLAF